MVFTLHHVHIVWVLYTVLWCTYLHRYFLNSFSLTARSREDFLILLYSYRGHFWRVLCA